MNRYIVKHTETMGVNKLPERIGGKADQLFNISPDLLPYWSVITADCPDDKLEEVCHEIWQDIGLWLSLYAVRSSAVGEDGKDQSFAGIFESKLNVPITGIELAVREVRASAKTIRARKYLQSMGKVMMRNDEQFLEKISPEVAVIVMPMVKAWRSGVLFSQEPIEGTDRMLVEWEEGVGGVVDGTTNTEHFFIDRDNFWVTPKESWAGIWNTPAQGGPAMLRIYEEAKRLEKNYGRPVDIEWAINEEGRPFVLQVRPITAGVTA